MVDGDETMHGVPRLDRQAQPQQLDAEGRPLRPQRAPEARPTRLQDSFIYLSIVALVCGVIAITALELGSPMSSLLVKVPVLVGGTILLAVTADALLRVWRSVAAWRALDAGRARFRLVWVVVLAGSLVAEAAIMLVVLSA